MASEPIDLASLVAGALLVANSIGHALIEVEESDGIVTLKGTVESEQDILTAEALVLDCVGVVKVINLLKTPDLQARDVK